MRSKTVSSTMWGWCVCSLDKGICASARLASIGGKWPVSWLIAALSGRVSRSYCIAGIYRQPIWSLLAQPLAAPWHWPRTMIDHSSGWDQLPCCRCSLFCHFQALMLLVVVVVVPVEWRLAPGPPNCPCLQLAAVLRPHLLAVGPGRRGGATGGGGVSALASCCVMVLCCFSLEIFSSICVDCARCLFLSSS